MLASNSGAMITKVEVDAYGGGARIIYLNKPILWEIHSHEGSGRGMISYIPIVGN